MLRCASSFPGFRRGRLIAAYATVRLIPRDSRALPAASLRSRSIFITEVAFYVPFFDTRRPDGVGVPAALLRPYRRDDAEKKMVVAQDTQDHRPDRRPAHTAGGRCS